MSPTESLSREWSTLQNNYEQYEQDGLKIKLVSVMLTTIGLAFNVSAILLAAMVLLLWMQEGIYRTFQSRLGQRILQLESFIKQGSAAPGNSFQLHSEWLTSRKKGLALLGEYATSACRPTVAFPHAVLGLLIAWL